MAEAPPSPETSPGVAAKPALLWSRFGLGSRLVLLVVCFVMLAEIAVFVPSIGNYRDNWLRDRLSSANTAALVFEAAPAEMVPPELAASILASVGARTIVLKMHDTRRLLAVSDMPERVDESFDLRNPSPWDSMAAALRAMVAPPGRVLQVVGNGPMGAEFVEVTIDEAPLLTAMRHYSANILLVSLIISGIVGGLAYLSLHWMVLRPVRRLTSSIMEFGSAPQDASRVIEPSGHNHEIGLAEEALAQMQEALARELNEKKNLAALGLAVAKINHDLRNILSSAQLLSDRLAELSDPLARRLAPRLVATLDRAIAFCQSTLAYGRAVERPSNFKRVALRSVLCDVAEQLVPADLKPVAVEIDVFEDIEVHADAEQLFRVFLNLIRNAVDALESAGPQPGRPALVRVSAMRDDGRVIVHVADSGPGIPEYRRERLFDAFQGSSRDGGSGLGLSIAADLVRAQGGEISLVETADNHLGGALFRITLPAARQRRRGHAA